MSREAELTLRRRRFLYCLGGGLASLGSRPALARRLPPIDVGAPTAFSSATFGMG